jgi:CBS domain-containing protein
VSTLRDIALVQASVPATATFGDAARALSEHRLPAIAVVEDGRVVGLFTDVDLLRGLFPAYLGELRHTAFLDDDPGALAARAAECRREPITRHMRRDVELLDVETSATHAAERFLHSPEAALPVVENGRYLGMLPRAEFAFAMLRRLTERGG